MIRVPVTGGAWVVTTASGAPVPCQTSAIDDRTLELPLLYINYAGNLDLGLDFAHFIAVFPSSAARRPPHARTHAVCRALASVRACRMLIGACNPMLRPIHGVQA